MKKLQTVVLIMATMFTLGALLATVASAETTLLAEWLANGAAISSNLASGTSIQLKLEDNKAPLVGKSGITCSIMLVGTVGANGAGSITSIKSLTSRAIGNLTAGEALLGTGAGSDCAANTGCAEGSATSPIEVWPVGLPWATTLFLMENGEILTLLSAAEFGYEILCLVLGVNTEDKCTQADAEFLVQNNATTGDAEIPSGSKLTPNINCTLGGAGSGVNETVGVGTLTLTGGELLSVSSE